MSQAAHSLVAAELAARHRRANDAFRQKDLAAYLDTFAASLAYRQADGKRLDRDQLAQQVKAQLAGLSSVENSYESESLVIEGEQATEVLRQTASIELVHLGVIRRRWNLFRRGRYVWRKFGGDWQIAEVEVLEERVVPGGTRLGLR
jgi:hypothetical protein